MGINTETTTGTRIRTKEEILDVISSIAQDCCAGSEYSSRLGGTFVDIYQDNGSDANLMLSMYWRQHGSDLLINPTPVTPGSYTMGVGDIEPEDLKRMVNRLLFGWLPRAEVTAPEPIPEATPDAPAESEPAPTPPRRSELLRIHLKFSASGRTFSPFVHTVKSVTKGVDGEHTTVVTEQDNDEGPITTWVAESVEDICNALAICGVGLDSAAEPAVPEPIPEASALKIGAEECPDCIYKPDGNPEDWKNGTRCNHPEKLRPTNKTATGCTYREAFLAHRIAAIALQYKDATDEADKQREHDLAEIFPVGWKIRVPWRSEVTEAYVRGINVDGWIQFKFGPGPSSEVHDIDPKHIIAIRPNADAKWQSLI